MEAQSYLPQRPPFLMVGELISATETLTQTTFTIPSDNIFASSGFFTEEGLIENMAQTAGAGTSYLAVTAGKPAPMGYIAALKNVSVTRLPAVNETITTNAIFVQNLMGFHIIQAHVVAGEEEIANCEFRIFLKAE